MLEAVGCREEPEEPISGRVPCELGAVTRHPPHFSGLPRSVATISGSATAAGSGMNDAARSENGDLFGLTSMKGMPLSTAISTSPAAG